MMKMRVSLKALPILLLPALSGCPDCEDQRCGSDNNPPEAPGVSILPLSPRAGEDDLHCRVVVESTDPDGDEVEYTFVWSLDGSPVQGQTTDLPGDTLGADQINPSDFWTCTVTPSDGLDDGETGQASVQVLSEFRGWDEPVVALEEVADWIFTGEENEDQLGRITTSAGDVDGDGLVDLLLTAHGHSAGGMLAGKAYVILGASLGEPGAYPVSEADYGFLGEAAEDLAGHGAAPAGDVDGDGLDDLWISGYLHDGSTADEGRVYLVLGSSLGAPGTRSLGDADFVFEAERDNEHLGHELVSVGDVDGDGLPDLLTGAYNNDDSAVNAGKSYLLLGASLGEPGLYGIEEADYHLRGEQAGDESGLVVSGAGDVDGDGLDDVLVGAKQNREAGQLAGKVYLVLATSLASDLSLSLADHQFLGEAAGDYCCIVSGAGDVDADGRADLLFGAHKNDAGGDNSGRAYLFLGGNLGASGSRSVGEADFLIDGESEAAGSGGSVAGAGDVDADGFDDLLIGAPEFGNGPDERTIGRGYLLFGGGLETPGSLSLSEADFAFEGVSANQFAGWDFHTVGDVDGDGRGDLILGSPLQPDLAYLGEGRAYLLLTR